MTKQNYKPCKVHWYQLYCHQSILSILANPLQVHLNMKTILNFAIAAIVSLVISACSTPPKVTEAPTPKHESVAASSAAENASVTASGAETDAKNLASQLQEMQKKSVFFDVDEFAIKPEYRELIQQRAEFMKAHGSIVVTLEGNTDERGSSEYNLALGERRANSVRTALNILGVPDHQIKTVSMGEEHPRLTCHEEKCWQENRRADFIGKLGS
jgi:peptidoglycan-associated lipoprotein